MSLTAALIMFIFIAIGCALLFVQEKLALCLVILYFMYLVMESYAGVVIAAKYREIISEAVFVGLTILASVGVLVAIVRVTEIV